MIKLQDEFCFLIKKLYVETGGRLSAAVLLEAQ